MDFIEARTEVNAPVELCYRLWRNFESFPSFIRSIVSVSALPNRIWRWFIQDPQGHVVEWELKLEKDQPEKLLSWRSLESQDVDVDLWVDILFQRISASVTEINMEITIYTVGKSMNDRLEALYAISSESLELILAQFKSFVEQMALQEALPGQEVGDSALGDLLPQQRKQKGQGPPSFK